LRVTQIRLLLVFIVVGCTLPHDPRHTLEQVRAQRVMRVGVSEDPPFIVRHGDDAAGLEAAIVRGFAARLGVRVRWIWTAQEQQFRALHACQLDMMAGGFDSKTPWKKQVAVTRPYLESHEVLGAPPLVTIPDDLTGHEVTIEEGDPIGEQLTKENAAIHSVPVLGSNEQLVAGTRTRLRMLGYVTGRTLATHKRAFAVPPGENAFLHDLELYLAANHKQFAQAAGEPE
jgi:hypothetical protein